MLRRVVILSCAWAAALGAQTTINGSRTILGNWDASGALSTKPNQTGSALPGSCTIGQTFFLTGGSAGLYLCTAVNHWSAPAASGGGSATTYANIFDGSTAGLADGSSVTWTCGSGNGVTCTANWTAPNGVNAVHVAAWSAGAGGGGGGTDRTGPGGGGGGYFDGICPVTPGNTYAITVGMGGAGGSNQYGIGGIGGHSSLGPVAGTPCFTLIGATANSNSGWGGYLSGTSLYYGAYAQNNQIAAGSGGCSGGPTSMGYAIRTDVGGCGGFLNSNAGTAGSNAGPAPYGGGGGGNGGFGSATGGLGGTSGFGGAGGNGGGYGTSLIACQNGAIPGGGGGGAGASTSSGGYPGCNGARGEVRIYYTR